MRCGYGRRIEDDITVSLAPVAYSGDGKLPVPVFPSVGSIAVLPAPGVEADGSSVNRC